jgi:hypothetical protein
MSPRELTWALDSRMRGHDSAYSEVVSIPRMALVNCVALPADGSRIQSA